MIEIFWLRPQALWLLIPWLFVLVPLIILRVRQRLGLEQIIAPHLQQLMIQGRQPHSKLWRGLGGMAFFAILIVALAGPALHKVDMPVFNQDRGAVLLLDASMQTRAQDIAPDRFTQMRFKAIDLVEKFKDGQLGFIAYSGDAFAVNPLTRDGVTILQNLRVITPEIMPIEGHDPVLAMQAAIAQLANAGYQTGDIFWLTAGINQSDMQELRTLLRAHSYRINILAVGTSEGPPVRDAQGELLRDQRGRVMLPRLIPDYLQRISSETGGRFQSMTADNTDVANLFAHAEASASRHEGEISASDLSGEIWLDAGPWLALLLLPWLLPLARRGQLWMWPALSLLVLTQMPVTAVAASEPSSTVSGRDIPIWQRPFLTREQQAQQLFDQGNYVAAAERFKDPMRRGDALYRAGDFAASAAAYAQSAEGNAQAHFNRGNALAQLGDLDAALAAYDEGLALAPDWRELQENKELVEALRDQQEKEQQQQGEQQENGEPQESEDGQPEPSEEQSSEQDQQNQEQSQEPSQDEQAQEGQESEQNDAAPQDQDSEGQELADADAIEVDNLSAEEREELQQLLNRLNDDPSLLLQNRLRREAQRRRQQLPPRGF